MKNGTGFFNLKQLLIISFSFLIFTSCSIQQKISRSAKEVINDNSLQNAHIGISIFDPSANKYLFNYQGDKYFVPASNTKIPTCYAAMKYLGDSLTCFVAGENDTALFIIPYADPTLLHPDYKNQPGIDFLKKTNKNIYTTDLTWRSEALGPGWSWDDYNEDYMAERSPLPVYGNVLKWVQERDTADKPGSFIIYSVPEINWSVNFSSVNAIKFNVKRKQTENNYELTQGTENYKEINIPFVTNGINAAIELLPDTIGKTVTLVNQQTGKKIFEDIKISFHVVKSQPTDSVLKPMMNRSDNFFAEQSLLMVSNELLHIMNDEKVIDTLLKKDLKDLPQKPRWVDGSGLSRYNLFTPQDFVAILDKMRNEFGMDRVKGIFPTGDKGTLSSYYKADSGFIYGKTGTLSGVVAFSGFLYTKKGRLLIFSTLINNHNTSATAVRRAVEKFIERIRNKY